MTLGSGIPVGWRATRLKHVAVMAAGGTPSVDNPRYWTEDGDGLAWAAITDMTREPRLATTSRRVSEEGIRAARLPLGRPGTVLFAMYASLGAMAVLDVPATWNQAVLGITPRPGTSVDFVRYALVDSRRDLLSLARSNTQANLNQEQVGNLRILLPALSAQRSIVDFLDRECDNIAPAARAARAIPTALRGQFVEERRRQLATHVATTRLARITVSLDSRRVPLNREERSHRQGPIPYWGANSIQDYVDAYLFDETLVLVGEDGAPFFDERRDVAWVVRGKSWVNNHAHVLRVLDGWSPEYLAHVLNDTDYRRYITGATRDKLTQDALNSIRVPGLSLGEQEAVVQRLAGVASVHDAATERAESIRWLLEAYRDSLIHEAVTGKLDVTKVSERQMDERLHAAAEDRLDEVPV